MLQRTDHRHMGPCPGILVCSTESVTTEHGGEGETKLSISNPVSPCPYMASMHVRTYGPDQDGKGETKPETGFKNTSRASVSRESHRFFG